MLSLAEVIYSGDLLATRTLCIYTSSKSSEEACVKRAKKWTNRDVCVHAHGNAAVIAAAAGSGLWPVRGW